MHVNGREEKVGDWSKGHRDWKVNRVMTFCAELNRVMKFFADPCTSRTVSYRHVPEPITLQSRVRFIIMFDRCGEVHQLF